MKLERMLRAIGVLALALAVTWPGAALGGA